MTAGQPVAEVERMVRSQIPRTYMMLCTPGLSYLAYAGFIDPSQAFVGEMLGLLPIFTLEEGQISAVEKVRNMRGLIDFMQEFVSEFDELQHIAFIQSTPPLAHEARSRVGAPDVRGPRPGCLLCLDEPALQRSRGIGMGLTAMPVAGVSTPVTLEAP